MLQRNMRPGSSSAKHHIDFSATTQRARQEAPGVVQRGNGSGVGTDNVTNDGRSLMSTITYAGRSAAPAARADERPARKPIWRRLFDALVESQQRRAEREIARYLASRGGLLTDDMEREMLRRLSGNATRHQ